MEERIDRLDRLMEASAGLYETMQRNQEIMLDNQRRNEENRVEIQRRNEESRRRNEEDLRRLEQSHLEVWDLLQQLIQGVAVMQAEIVRIDETYS